MANGKNIGLINLDEDLQDKINKLVNYYNGAVSGKDDTTWEKLLDSLNNTIKELDENKVDTTELTKYLHKENDKVTAEMLSDELAAIINVFQKNMYRGKDDKITYADLSEDTTEKIEKIEDRLDYINNYLLNHGSGSDSGVDSTFLTETIENINSRIDANKTEADESIKKNATDIEALDERVATNEENISDMDGKYRKKTEQITINDMESSIQETLNTLSGSIAFTQADKDKLDGLKNSSGISSGGGSIGYIKADFPENETMLNLYVKKNYELIYYIVTGVGSEQNYVVQYTYVGIDGENAGKVLKTSEVMDESDSNTEILKFDAYAGTLLTNEERSTFFSSIIYSQNTKKVYLSGLFLAQKPIELLNQDIELEAGAVQEIATSELIASALNANIYITAKDEDGGVYDISHLITLTRYQDKIKLSNETENAITANVLIKDCAY